MTTLKIYIQNYLEYCRCRKHLDSKTLKAYQIDLNQYENFCSEIPKCMTKELIDDYITHLHKNYKTKTIKRKIASLKSFFRHMEYKEIIQENPFSNLELRFREARPLPKTIPLHYLQSFLTILYNQKETAVSEYQKRCCIRDIAVIELLFATGIRISELCSLKPSDVDLKNNSILIYGKGAKERIIHISNPDVISALECYQHTFQTDIDTCGYFFVNRLQKKLSDQSVRFMIKNYTKLANIDHHITPHMFRHSFATLLLEQDVDIRYIQQILGHSSISTTEIYTHVSQIKQKETLGQKHPRNLIDINKG